VVYFSLDIHRTPKEGKDASGFDAAEYTLKLWKKELPAVVEKATDLSELIGELQANPEKAFKAHGHKLGISKTIYFMSRGSATIDSIADENLTIKYGNGTRVQIATDFIFGNAVRDGSGIVNIDDFLNMTEFNNVSVELNKLVREKVVTDLRTFAKPGLNIVFAGAFEVNETAPNISTIRIIPVKVTLSQ
jgi:predicted lipoprotein